jgi:division/cell wall cluster transcriptional repressor MraZ
MLAGSSQAKLDDKWRFVLPSKFRAHAGTSLYLAKADQGQLQLLTKDAYDVELARYVAAYEAGRDPNRWEMRAFMETVEPITLDSQARVPVIGDLRGHASLQERGELQLIGMHDRIEIWDTQTYQSARAMALAEGVGRAKQ